MFQYAFGLAYSLKNSTCFQLDLRYLNDRTPRKNFVYRGYDLDIFALESNLVHKIHYTPYQIYFVLACEYFQKRVCRINHSMLTGKYLESRIGYNKNIWDLPDGTYFDGYFQSYKYFQNINDLLFEKFKFKYSSDSRVQSLSQEINEKESICLNVRRGDFLTSNLLGAISPDYYYEAVDRLKQMLTNPIIYVFSDDVGWCRNNLIFPLPTRFVDHDYAGEKFRNYFELMLNCKHFIIPNSSFGWWAAYLSSNPCKTVIAPKSWFKNASIDSKDLIPDQWMTI